MVEVLDEFGNLVTSDNSTVVTASIATGTAGNLTETITATAVAGVATFDGVKFVGTPLANYRLDFKANGLTSVRSANFFVTHNSPIKLTVKTQPVGSATGSDLSTQPVLELRDQFDNIATSDNSTVITATVTTGNDSVLTGETATANNGIVTFDHLNLVGNPGEKYRITFSVADITVTSQDITLTHAAPAKLAIRTQPVGELTGELLATAPVIEVLDRFGNLATGDSTTSVTVSVKTGTGGAVVAGATATARYGVVTFSALKLTGAAGEPYTLNFASGSLTATESQSLTLSKYASVTFSYAATRYSPNGTVTPTFNTDSPADVSFSTASSALICTVDSATGAVTIKGVGTCNVSVAIAASTYHRTPIVTPTAALGIAKAFQAPVTITSASTVNYQSTLAATATGGSGNGAIMFSVNGECRIVGSTVVPNDAGSLCQLTATRLGDANYLPESSETQVVMINMIDQAALTIANSATLPWGPVTLVTVGGSGTGAVSYEVTDAGSAQCAVVGNRLTPQLGGSCVVRATKALSNNFFARQSAPFTMNFAQIDQSLAFTSNVPNFPVAKSYYSPVASTSSGLPVSFSIAAGAGDVCKFVGARVYFMASGDCLIAASSDGDTRYLPASASQLIRVGMLNQQITFDAIGDRLFGTASFAVQAESNSGLNVTFALGDNSGEGVCIVTSNGLVKLLTAGTCELVAKQAGNSTYAPASDVVQSFVVSADIAGSPYIYAVAGGVNQVTATFIAPSYTGGTPITGYQLVAIDPQGNQFENANCAIDGNPVSCSVDGLAPGVSYSMKVAAITSAGLGRYSAVAQAMTPGDNPVAVSNLTAQSLDTGLMVAWTPPVALDGEFVSYEVFVTPRGDAFPDVPTVTVSDSAATSTLVEGFKAASYPSMIIGRAGFSRAAASNGYEIKVVTVTSVSRGDANSSQAVILGKSVAAAPVTVLASPIGENLVVTWAMPTIDGGSLITGYQVKANNKVICTTTADVTNCTIKNVAFSTTYRVEVFAINEQGLSNPGTVSYKTKAAPKPEPKPEPSATDEPTPAPSASPTTEPTTEPTPAPTEEPTPSPSPTDAPVIPIVIPSFTPGEPVADPAIGATGDDNAPPQVFDPTGSPEAIAAATETVTKVTAVVGAVAAAAGAAAAAAGAAAGAAGDAGAGAGAGAASGGASSGARGGSSDSSGGGSIANIDAAHEQFTVRRRGRGDRWRLWKSKFMTWLDKISIAMVTAFAKVSPILSKATVDGAYLRASMGVFGILPTVATFTLAVISITPGTYILPPVWPVFLAMVIIGVFDAFAGLVGTTVFIVGSISVQLINGNAMDLGDVRMLLGVMIAGFGPVLLANQFRHFRRDPQNDGGYSWERIVDMAVLPFFGGWTAASMIATLPALAGLTLSAANHVNDFAMAVAVATVARVVLEEVVARLFPARLDYLHPTEVPETYRGHRYVALGLRVAIFIFVTAALMGNAWQVWVGSILFALPTLLGWFKEKLPNFPWLWRILPHGIPGLALVLFISQITANGVGALFAGSKDLGLWSFALLPIPLLILGVLGMLGREGEEGEVRLMKRPSMRWVYRIGGVVMLIVTMKLAGVI